MVLTHIAQLIRTSARVSHGEGRHVIGQSQLLANDLRRKAVARIRHMQFACLRIWQRFRAVTRVNLSAVCAESAPLGCHDYHTYADDRDNAPWGTVGGARCKRCGKRFRLL